MKENKKLHLDSEYRRKFELFELDNGIIEDSRLKNWRDVKWNKVIKITVSIDEKINYLTNKDKNGFIGFFNFRTFGKEAQYNKEKKYTGHKIIQEWVIGWTDGITAYLTAIDFYTGDISREFEMTIKQLKGHIHPDIMPMVII